MTTPTPTPEVVEAVAKAIHDDRVPELDWEHVEEYCRVHYRLMARAAIAEYLKQTGAGK